MTFQARLRKAQEAGNLTVADLARWFEVPYGTVRGWVQDGHEPSGPPLDRTQIAIALDRLERAIRKRAGFPLRRLSAAARIAALSDIRIKALTT